MGDRGRVCLPEKMFFERDSFPLAHARDVDAFSRECIIVGAVSLECF